MPKISIPEVVDVTPELAGDRIDARIVAAIAGTRVPVIHEMARKDRIPHWRIGRAVRFSRRAINEWIANGGTASEEQSMVA